jgi:hypothetical protein
MPIIINYINDIRAFQESLLGAFIEKYPAAVDFKYLTDFPRAGELEIDGELWRFSKHGVGVRFVRKMPTPCVVIDMHNNFGDSAYIDSWRASKYLLSIAVIYDIKEIERDIDGLSSRKVI